MSIEDRDTDAVTRPELYVDLFESLSINRRGVHADEMVQALLRLDSGRERQLVGLIDYERAVYFSPDERTLRGYTFDKHGVSESDVDMLWRPISDVVSWVDAHREELDWIHPRFRRVLDLPEESE